MICLGYITIQDFKERQVYWFLFPLASILLGLVHFLNTAEPLAFLNYIALNVLFVTLILGVLYLTTRIIFKKRFLNHSLGLGDILFFYAFAIGFPTITFVILFTNAILFALLLFFVFKKKLHLQTVPLAGLMSSFLIFIFAYNFIFPSPTLYGY